ncbi:response regulator transcription factor [Microvirga sp. 0TCS3.31]
MNHHVVSHEQILSIAQNALPSVTTVLVCQNTLIRTGISRILAGTHFVISDETVEQTPEPPVLCLIHAEATAGELAEAVERMKAQWPSARVVLLTESMGPAASRLSRQGGLDGLCSTAMGREALIKALELVMLGETFVSSAFVVSLLDEASRRRDVQPDGAVTVFPAVPAIASKLSEREAQILSYLTEGASNKHIARDLGVAEATVKVHLKSILRKVKAANRTQAAMWAQQQMKRAANDGILAAAE